MSVDLPAHHLRIALIHPQIAPNTGNIARLCVATGTELHLVRPLGFVLSDRELKRSAMDYWPRLKLTVHDDLASFLAAVGEDRAWMLTSKGRRSLWDADFRDGDWVVFGNETQGLPAEMIERDPQRAIRIPQAPDERCLNLSTAAGITLYQALWRIAGDVGCS
jgi:tRNA (cytidine/uridine-2'-O-)-methyltransferase